MSTSESVKAFAVDLATSGVVAAGRALETEHVFVLNSPAGDVAVALPYARIADARVIFQSRRWRNVPAVEIEDIAGERITFAIPGRFRTYPILKALDAAERIRRRAAFNATH